MYGQVTNELIDQCFDDGADHVVALMRHSARTYEQGLHDLENQLTEEGRHFATEFGKRLNRPLHVRGYSSPVQRCIDTSELILAAHEAAGGDRSRSRPIEALGPFYALDEVRMWKGMQIAGGLVAYVRQWIDGQLPAGAVMSADLAARFILDVMADKFLSRKTEGMRQLDLCVSHDITLYMVRDRLLGQSPESAEVKYLDALVLFERDGQRFMASHHGDPITLS